MLCPLKQDEFPSSTGQEAGRDFIYFDSTIKPCWIALCTANLFCFQSSKPEKAITLIWMTLCQSSTLICLITCIDRKRWDLLLPIYLLHKKHHTACYNCTSFSCLEHAVVSIHFCCLYSCLATVFASLCLPLSIWFVLYVQRGCFLTAFRFRRTSEIFQTVFLLCSSTTACSTDPCQVQCGNDKHPLYPSSELPAALSHKRDSHILALDCALMSRINLEKHKANVSSGHVNMANSARRLTGKERKRETSRQKVWVRSGKSDRW